MSILNGGEKNDSGNIFILLVYYKQEVFFFGRLKKLLFFIYLCLKLMLNVVWNQKYTLSFNMCLWHWKQTQTLRMMIGSRFNFVLYLLGLNPKHYFDITS